MPFDQPGAPPGRACGFTCTTVLAPPRAASCAAPDCASVTSTMTTEKRLMAREYTTASPGFGALGVGSSSRYNLDGPAEAGHHIFDNEAGDHIFDHEDLRVG